MNLAAEVPPVVDLAGVFLVTFLVFTFEGLLHYNIGKNGLKSYKDAILPPWKEFCKIIGVVFVFSVIDTKSVK